MLNEGDHVVSCPSGKPPGSFTGKIIIESIVFLPLPDGSAEFDPVKCLIHPGTFVT